MCILLFIYASELGYVCHGAAVERDSDLWNMPFLHATVDLNARIMQVFKRKKIKLIN